MALHQKTEPNKVRTRVMLAIYSWVVCSIGNTLAALFYLWFTDTSESHIVMAVLISVPLAAAMAVAIVAMFWEKA